MNQGTPEWLASRAGFVTASRFKDVLAKVKVGEAATRKAYRWQVATERLTGNPCDTFKNAAMEWGTATEPHARAAYETARGLMVDEVGFIHYPHAPFIGCSPDGLIGADGGVEIKCPANSVIHVQTLADGMPPEHKPQVQGAMWVTGRKWWDFVSFDPRLPERLRLHVQRIERDEDYIAKLAAEVAAFQSEVETMLKQLEAL